MRPPIRIATREAIVGHDEFVGRTAGTRRVSRRQPGHGLVVRCGAWHAGASAIRSTWRLPLALGHGLAIAAAIAMAA